MFVGKYKRDNICRVLLFKKKTAFIFYQLNATLVSKHTILLIYVKKHLTDPKPLSGSMQ